MYQNSKYTCTAIFLLHHSVYETHITHDSSIRSDQGIKLETSALESLYGGQFTLSIQLIKPNHLENYPLVILKSRFMPLWGRTLRMTTKKLYKNSFKSLTWFPSIFMTGVHAPSPHPKFPIWQSIDVGVGPKWNLISRLMFKLWNIKNRLECWHNQQYLVTYLKHENK